MPCISVVVPVYNLERLVPVCLDSIASQSFADIEVLCVDDGSTDGSGAILDAFAARDPRFKVVHQANTGQATARNRALDIATGEFVTFVDADDLLPPRALETFRSIALESNAPVVVSRRYIRMSRTADVAADEDVAAGDAAPSWMLHTDAFADFVRDRRIFSNVFDKLYRRELFATRRFIDGIQFEDWVLATNLFGDIPCYASTERGLYVYNDTGASTVRSVFTRKKVCDYLAGIRAVHAHFRDRPAAVRRLARQRIAVAVKMLVGSVRRSHDGDLSRFCAAAVRSLVDEDVLRYGDLPLKVRFRLFLFGRA